MAVDQQRVVEIDVDTLLGLNTALQPTSLAPGQWRSLKNAYMSKIRACAKRPGSIPVTTSALGASIKHLTSYKSSTTSNPALLAASGTTLYKFDGVNVLTAQTMTNALNTSDIYTEDFTNASLVSRLLIGDSASLKAYDGTAVANVAAAADDPSPAPPNGLTSINAKGHKYLWVYSGHVFSSPGTNELFYSKRYQFDYWPTTQNFYLVRDNDFINGCGVAFDDVCLIPMRRGWSILTGQTFDNFDSSQFLNTAQGVIAPRSIAKATYPDGTQTILYLSDDGVYEIFMVSTIGGTRVYATRALMKDLIEFNAVGFSESEKAAAVAKFDETLNMYMLYIKKGSQQYTYCMDARNKQWYVWTLPFDVMTSLSFGGVLYFAGSTGHLHKYDSTLASDWNESTKTTGTPIDWDCYTDLIAFENSGFESILDYIIVSAKQYSSVAKIDVSINFFSGTADYLGLVDNEIMVWGSGHWGDAVWYNVNFTDLVGKPIRKPVHKKSYYFQIRFHNNRNELVEMYRYQLKGRSSGK
jgi:hypothetical protein